MIDVAKHAERIIAGSGLRKTITAYRGAATLGTFDGLAMQTSGIRQEDGAAVYVSASATLAATLQHGDRLTWQGAVAATKGYTIHRIDYDGSGMRRLLLDDHLGAP